MSAIAVLAFSAGAAACAHAVEPDRAEARGDAGIPAGGSGGAFSGGTGLVSSTGGARAAGSGGGTANGGTTASGGQPASGGGTANGGTTASGGQPASGGGTANGGSGGTVVVVGGDCPTLPPDAGPPVVRLQYENTEDGSPTNGELKPFLNLVNESGSEIPLTELTVRYWYTKEPLEPTQVLECDYAMIDCGKIKKTDAFHAVTPARPGADTYLEVAFDDGTLAAGAETGVMKLRIHTSGFQNYSEADDYSYGTVRTFTNWGCATVYRNGDLIWGTEP